MLVGPPGVGRRALVQRIVAHNPKIFDTIKAGESFDAVIILIILFIGVAVSKIMSIFN